MMKSASELSSMIRAKKKKMQDDPDVIDSSGSPQLDAQDIYNDHVKHLTDDLDENVPKEFSKEADDDEAMVKRKARIAKMMMK